MRKCRWQGMGAAMVPGRGDRGMRGAYGRPSECAPIADASSLRQCRGMIRHAVFVAAFLSVATAGCTSAALPMRTSACDILANPQSFQRKLVEFWAFQMPAMEALTVSAEACRNRSIVVDGPTRGQIGLLPDDAGRWPYAKFTGIVEVTTPNGSKDPIVFLLNTIISEPQLRKPSGPYP